MRHVRSISEIGTEGVVRVLRTARHMEAVNSRPVPKVPALVGRTVVSLFFEDSTRTRISFETAARRLSADTVNFSVSTSSLNKGESLRDTIETVSAMGASVFVVRHATSGVPWQIAEWTDASIVNAGDGWHQHPTQALLDCYTVLARRGLDPSPTCLSGLRIAIVGDSRHSRVARSCLEAFTSLGADVVLVGPSTLLPPDTTSWNVSISNSLDDVLPHVDVVYMLRMQRERMNEALVPDLAEYSRRYGLDETRWSRTRPEAVLMHPGPMNRGVEMMFDPSTTPQSAIVEQVTHGISVRMAVLFELLASGEEVPT